MLHVLDLSNNKLSGKIPSDLQRLQGLEINVSSQTSLVPYVDQLENTMKFSNTLVEDLTIVMKRYKYDLPYLIDSNTILDLSSNNLSGEIHTTIGCLSSLRLLNLSGNHLEGVISASLGNISTL